eukprot:gene1735-3353_t
MCENVILDSICVETAPAIFYTADLHNAKNLRERSLSFILSHFDAFSESDHFNFARRRIFLGFDNIKYPAATNVDIMSLLRQPCLRWTVVNQTAIGSLTQTTNSDGRRQQRRI